MAKIIELKNSWNAIILRYFTFDDKISQFFFSLVENWWKRNDLRYLPVYNFNFTRKMTPKKFLKNTWKRSGFAHFYYWQTSIWREIYLFPLGVHPILGIYSHQGKCSWKSKFHSKRKVSPPGLKETIFNADFELRVPGRGNLCCSMESKAAMETKSTPLSSVSSYSIE